MIGFKEFLTEEYADLSEKLITFANQAYPKFGTVVIMAGGAGSGKGFVLSKLIGVEGYTFDVDALKSIAAKTPFIVKKIKDELGVDLKALAGDMKNPENVSALHNIIGGHLALDNKRLQALYSSILTAAPDRKPNLIFDVTMKDLSKFATLTHQLQTLGYDMKNIHIVWVVNDIEVAKEQNAKRGRSVPAEILVSTHRGVSATMKDILTMGTSLGKYMNGDIVLAFNKCHVDVEFTKGTNKKAGYVNVANYVYVKRAGHPATQLDDLKADIRSKIASYVPKDIDWV